MPNHFTINSIPLLGDRGGVVLSNKAEDIDDDTGTFSKRRKDEGKL
jgi:hypothetical protein